MLRRQDRETQITELDRCKIMKAAKDDDDSDEETRRCAASGSGARPKTPARPTLGKTRFVPDLLRPEKSSTPKTYTLKEWNNDSRTIHSPAPMASVGSNTNGTNA